MIRVQQLEAEIERLRRENISLHSQKEVLERAWSPDVKAGITPIGERMNRNFQRIADAEQEIHQLTWHRRHGGN